MGDPGRPRVVWSDGPVPRDRAARAPEVEPVDPAAQTVRVRRERAGRGGKTVTVATPVFLDRESAASLARELKRGAGSGGTLRDGADAGGRPCFAIEVQGDHVEAVVRRLTALGFRAVRSGG